MFRKIISHLPFSPALIVQLGEYANKIQREVKLRLISVIMMIVLVVFQFVTIIATPSGPTADTKNSPTPSLDSNLEASIATENTNLQTGDSLQTAKPNDKLTYTLSAINTGEDTATTTFAVSVSDLLEYADLSEYGNGSVDRESGILYWDSVEIGTQESQTKTFSAIIHEDISNQARNGKSQDCSIEVAFANHRSVTDVQCPVLKNIESVTSSLPSISSTLSASVVVSLSAIGLFLLLRARQLRKEIKTIRHNINNGGLL